MQPNVELPVSSHDFVADSLYIFTGWAGFGPDGHSDEPRVVCGQSDAGTFCHAQTNVARSMPGCLLRSVNRLPARLSFYG